MKALKVIILGLLLNSSAFAQSLMQLRTEAGVLEAGLEHILEKKKEERAAGIQAIVTRSVEVLSKAVEEMEKRPPEPLVLEKFLSLALKINRYEGTLAMAEVFVPIYETKEQIALLDSVLRLKKFDSKEVKKFREELKAKRLEATEGNG